MSYFSVEITLILAEKGNRGNCQKLQPFDRERGFLYAISDHASCDKSSATICSLDQMGTELLRPTMLTGRMNDS